MKLFIALASAIVVSQAGATVLPDVGPVFERPVVNRCISMLIGENVFGEEERNLILDRIDKLGVKTYSKALLQRLHGFSTELPAPPHIHMPERSRKPSRLSRLIRDLNDPTIDKELHVIKGKANIEAFLNTQAVEQVTLDAAAKAHVGSDYKAGRAAVSAGVIAAATGIGYGYAHFLGGPPLVGVLLASATGFYHAHVLGDRAQYLYRKLFKTQSGDQPSDWRAEQLHFALDKVRGWTPASESETTRYFGVTSVIPDALADALHTANKVEDIDPALYKDLYEFRATNVSRWTRMGKTEANFLSADFIFTPSENPEEEELVVVARLARQYDL